MMKWSIESNGRNVRTRDDRAGDADACFRQVVHFKSHVSKDHDDEEDGDDGDGGGGGDDNHLSHQVPRLHRHLFLLSADC